MTLIEVNGTGRAGILPQETVAVIDRALPKLRDVSWGVKFLRDDDFSMSEIPHE